MPNNQNLHRNVFFEDCAKVGDRACGFVGVVAFAMVIGLLPPRPMRAQLADVASPSKTWETSWDTFVDEIERLYRTGTSADEVDKLFADKETLKSTDQSHFLIRSSSPSAHARATA